MRQFIYLPLREYKEQKVQTCVLPQSTLRVHCAQSRTHFCSLYSLNGKLIPGLFEFCDRLLVFFQRKRKTLKGAISIPVWYMCWMIGFLCFFSIPVYSIPVDLSAHNICNDNARFFGSYWPRTVHNDNCSCDRMEKEVQLNLETDDEGMSDEQINKIITKAYSALEGCVETAKQNKSAAEADKALKSRNLANVKDVYSERCFAYCHNYIDTVTKKCPNFDQKLKSQCNDHVCTQVFVDDINRLSQIHAVSVENKIRNKIKQKLDPIVSRCKVKKERCVSFCKHYAEATSHGCPNHSNSFVNGCDSICNKEDVVNYFLVEGREMTEGSIDGALKAFERDWSEERGKCIGEAKETFVAAYTGQCGEKIKKIAEGHEKTILCAEEATKQKPQCKEYCQTEADKLYSTADNYQFIAHMRQEGKSSDDDENQKRVYQSLVAEDMGGLVQSEIEKLEIINDENKLVSPFSWWLCEKGKGQACESDLYRALEEAEKLCSDLQKEARECCYQPEQCVGGGLAASLGSLGKLHVSIAGIKGQKRMCEAVQQASGMYAGMQGAMAAQCINKANACSQGCNEEVEKVAEVFRKTCNHDPRSKGGYNESKHSCDKKLFDHYMKMYRGHMSVEQIKIGEVSEECKKTGQESNRRIQDMNTHLGASLLAGMKECGQKPKEWKPTPPPEGCPPNCPPPVPTCPPNCPAPPPTPPPVEPPGGIGGGGPSKKVADPFADDPLPQAANPFGEDPDLGEGIPDMGKGVKKGMSGLLGGGGGSGGGGLGGLGGGGPSGVRDRGGKAPARKKKVLLGFKGGKFTGYGGSSSSSGEERSRRRASRSGKKKRGVASLDLKKLLPKGKQLNNKVGKFGSPHDNIFQRMSDRIQWMCRTEQISCK